MLDTVRTISASPASLDTLSPADLRRVIDFRDWAMAPVAEKDLPGGDMDYMQRLANRLDVDGLPIDRITTAIEWLHTDYSGKMRSWVRGKGVEERFFQNSADDSPIYLNSPYYYVHQTRQWLELRLDETPDDAFNIVPDLKAEGYTHYICVPLIFTNGVENGMTVATKRPEGFSARDLAFMRAIVPTIGVMMELRITHKMFDNILRFYVGDEPHRAILSGSVGLGKVKRIRSSLFFIDMRNYTSLSHGMEPEAVAELLNAYFQCVVPDVVERGGEVLKYMGDGLLAIFRERDDQPGAAAAAAYEAAHAVFACIRALNESGRFSVPVEAGIALHHGEAVYGNIGAGQRLDFTVVGRDVNIASRIAGQNRPLGEPLLMSDSFVKHLDHPVSSLGEVPLAGLPEPFTLYKPSPAADGSSVLASLASACGSASGRSSAMSPRPEAAPAAP